MNILVVCSGNFPNFSFEKNQAFIFDQVNSLRSINKEVFYYLFFIKGKGILGYLNNLSQLKIKIRKYEINKIHAHGGMSGLLVNLQRKVPIITTFHGSDINFPKLRIISSLVSLLCKYSIVVSKNLKDKIIFKKNIKIIPCGVDLNLFFPINKDFARKSLGLDLEKKYLLFSSSFDNPVKNYKLLNEALILLPKDLSVIELKGYTRKQVCLLLNAVDVSILTSFSEGSPQFIKEAMACNCPIVSVDVGDINKVIGNTDGCFIASFDAEDIRRKIQHALAFGRRTSGCEIIKLFSIDKLAEQILALYNKN